MAKKMYLFVAGQSLRFIFSLCVAAWCVRKVARERESATMKQSDQILGENNS
jgi:hypothetical protein